VQVNLFLRIKLSPKLGLIQGSLIVTDFYRITAFPDNGSI